MARCACGSGIFPAVFVFLVGCCAPAVAVLPCGQCEDFARGPCSMPVTGFSVRAKRTALRQPLPRPWSAWPVAAFVIVNIHHRLFRGEPEPVANGRGDERRIGVFHRPGEQGEFLAEQSGERVGARLPPPGGKRLSLEPAVELHAHLVGDRVPLGPCQSHAQLRVLGTEAERWGRMAAPGSKVTCSDMKTSFRFPAGIITTKWCPDSRAEIRSPSSCDETRFVAHAQGLHVVAVVLGLHSGHVVDEVLAGLEAQMSRLDLHLSVRHELSECFDSRFEALCVHLKVNPTAIVRSMCHQPERRRSVPRQRRCGS